MRHSHQLVPPLEQQWRQGGNRRNAVVTEPTRQLVAKPSLRSSAETPAGAQRHGVRPDRPSCIGCGQERRALPGDRVDAFASDERDSQTFRFAQQRLSTVREVFESGNSLVFLFMQRHAEFSEELHRACLGKRAQHVAHKARRPAQKSSSVTTRLSHYIANLR